MNSWKKNTILFLISQCVTLFGSQIVQFAIVWFVTLNTASGFWVSLFSVCAYLPQFLISFVGGVWADRYNKKFLIIAADFSIAITTAVMFFLIPFISGDKVLIICLLMMSLIRSVGTGIQTPAVNALLPCLVPYENLMRFNGINATMQSVVQFASPAVAGVVLTMGKLQPTLLIDVITAIIGIGIFLFVKVNLKTVDKVDEKSQQAESNIPSEEKIAGKVADGEQNPEQNSQQNSFFFEIKNALSYAAKNKLIGNLLLVYASFIFLSVPSGYLSGLFVTRNFGNTYWYLTAVELVGFGAMALGGILMTTFSNKEFLQNRSKTLGRGFFIFGLMASAMGFSKNIYLYLVIMAIYGVMLTVIQTAITTVLQEKTESSMIGRIFGFMSSLYSLCYPLGMLIFGPLADFVSLKWMMCVSGVVLILISLRIMRKHLGE